jgi:tRNA pseudouridine13 synthase
VTAFADEVTALHACATFNSLPGAFGKPFGQADFRCANADFKVSECGLVPSGTGEHLMFRLRKDGQNTRWVAKRLAESLYLPYRSVSYAGLKDRHAITEQWFSAHIPGLAEPDISRVQIEGVEILEVVRHDRKLRPGQLSYNYFEIRLRNVSDITAAQLDTSLDRIAVQGVPNYFGPQRFGHDGANLTLADGAEAVRQLDREQRSFVLSAWRGALFNGYLGQRVAAGNWQEELPGEKLLSDRPRGVAQEDTSVFQNELLPAGLLWGKGAALATEGAGRLESEWFERFPMLCSALEAAGSRASRRVLRLRVGGLRWEHKPEELKLEFALGPGAYATSVLNEIISISNKSQRYE